MTFGGGLFSQFNHRHVKPVMAKAIDTDEMANVRMYLSKLHGTHKDLSIKWSNSNQAIIMFTQNSSWKKQLFDLVSLEARYLNIILKSICKDDEMINQLSIILNSTIIKDELYWFNDFYFLVCMNKVREILSLMRVKSHFWCQCAYDQLCIIYDIDNNQINVDHENDAKRKRIKDMFLSLFDRETNIKNIFYYSDVSKIKSVYNELIQYVFVHKDNNTKLSGGGMFSKNEFKYTSHMNYILDALVKFKNEHDMIMNTITRVEFSYILAADELVKIKQSIKKASLYLDVIIHFITTDELAKQITDLYKYVIKLKSGDEYWFDTIFFIFCLSKISITLFNRRSSSFDKFKKSVHRNLCAIFGMNIYHGEKLGFPNLFDPSDQTIDFQTIGKDILIAMHKCQLAIRGHTNSNLDPKQKKFQQKSNQSSQQSNRESSGINNMTHTIHHNYGPVHNYYYSHAHQVPSHPSTQQRSDSSQQRSDSSQQRSDSSSLTPWRIICPNSNCWNHQHNEFLLDEFHSTGFFT